MDVGPAVDPVVMEAVLQRVRSLKHTEKEFKSNPNCGSCRGQLEACEAKRTALEERLLRCEGKQRPLLDVPPTMPVASEIPPPAHVRVLCHLPLDGHVEDLTGIIWTHPNGPPQFQRDVAPFPGASGSMYFEGAYLTATVRADVDFAGAFTVQGWVRPDLERLARLDFFAVNGDEVSLQHDRVRFSTVDTDLLFEAMPSRQWTYFCLTRDHQDVVRLYTNGILRFERALRGDLTRWRPGSLRLGGAAPAHLYQFRILTGIALDGAQARCEIPQGPHICLRFPMRRCRSPLPMVPVAGLPRGTYQAATHHMGSPIWGVSLAVEV